MDDNLSCQANHGGDDTPYYVECREGEALMFPRGDCEHGDQEPSSEIRKQGALAVSPLPTRLSMCPVTDMTRE